MSRALAREKAGGADVLLHLVHVGPGQGLQGGEAGKQGGGDLVDPLVGTLGGQTHGEEQLVVLAVVQRADSLGIGLLEALYNGQHVLLCFHWYHLVGQYTTLCGKKRESFSLADNCISLENYI